MENIANYLKDYPKGTKLYSPIFGDVYLSDITDIFIQVKIGQDYHYFDLQGRYNFFLDGECLLFLSKENRNWSTFESKKPNQFKKFNYKPFDKVIARVGGNGSYGMWQVDFFSHFENEVFICVGGYFDQLLPYTPETAHLVGTRDDY